MGHDVIDQITTGSGLSASALAARSGLARSTQYRIRNRSVDPTVGSLRELALAAGYELDLSLAPLSDPDAARAARMMLDQTYASSSERGERSIGVDEWVERLRRWVPDDDPVEIVAQAGRSASVLHRPGAQFLRGRITELKIASAADYSDQTWFLSGAAVIDRIDEQADDAADRSRAPYPYIVHCSDPHRLVRLLENMERSRPEKAGLIVVPLTDGIEVGSWQAGPSVLAPLTLVAPIQGIIDSFGIGGAIGEAAERIARRW